MDGDPLATLLPISTGEGSPPLFCFHAASGISLVYSRLVPHLGREQPIYGLQLPGLTRTAALPRSMDELVETYVGEMRRVCGAGRYRLLGWSGGGNLAHAVAVRLQRSGDQVDLLALIDAHPAELRPVVSDEQLHAEVRTKVEQTELLRDHADPATGAIVNWLQALERHEAGVFSGGALFFGAAKGELPVPIVVDAWRPYVSGRVEVDEVPSDHDGMLDIVPARQIGARVAMALSQLAQPGGR